MDNIIYDSIIIGGGPAGMTAGIYLARAMKKVMLLEGEDFGGQIYLTTKVENYPGTGSIEGKALSNNMYEDLIRSGAEVFKESCVKLDLGEEVKKVYTKNNVFYSKTVILAMGVRSRQINAELENMYKGKGLSYSATSEGENYRGKKVAVIGGGKSAFVDAFYMSDIASEVTLIHRTDKFRVTEREVCKAKEEGINILPYYVMRKIIGDNRIEGLELVNVEDASIKKLDIDGLFISAGRVPNTEIVAGVVDTDDMGYIISDDCNTNIEGVYVCGDIRTKDLRQIVTAVSDGAICAIYAINYIRKV